MKKSQEELLALLREGITPATGCKLPVAVAGGLEKTKAIVGALRGGLIDILITDEDCAKVLVSKYNDNLEEK